MNDTRTQVQKLDAMLFELYREAMSPRPSLTRLRRLAEDAAWEFEPLRAILTGEPALPDLRKVGATGHRASQRRK